MTQTGTPAASRGSGAPKVGPLIVPAPVGPAASQSVSEDPLQWVRQRWSVEPYTTGKFMVTPVQPLSRSVHCWGTVRLTLDGPPSGFAGQTGTPGMHCTFSRSTSLVSFLATPLALAITLSCRTSDGLRPFLSVLRGTSRIADVPHAAVVRSVGGWRGRTTVAFRTLPTASSFLALPARVKLDSGVGLQPVRG